MKYLSLVCIILCFVSCSSGGDIALISHLGSSERIDFGADRLNSALTEAGYSVTRDDLAQYGAKNASIVVGTVADPVFASFLGNHITADIPSAKEGFVLKKQGNTIFVIGSDASGALYGCMELIDRLKETGKLPAKPDMTQLPEMGMRGACIGLQKTTYLPGRGVYEYPYTPESFPWFYDKELWIQYLDMLVENRFNTLYLWNGHPFASLVRLPDYPYAVEVDDVTFEKNSELFSFLTAEADKRGIWIVQMFYNIIISKPFAEKHQLATQDRSRRIVPLIADYTRKSIAAFIENYPHVGLLVTLGEAMGNINDEVQWFTETIIGGVKDGLQALGRTDEPPIVLRAHDTDGKRVMNAALPLYQNLYTMSKYNGESLTTYEPRDSWETIPKELSQLGSMHISNVHILANLEPFRYGSPDFIQKSVRAMRDIQGAKGLHLYPQTSYWDWPYTADNSLPRLNGMDRDWIWYKAWARYAWNPDRNRAQEVTYWTNKLNRFYGCRKGEHILTAYEETGEIAPKLLRTFGISDGNRQTLLLGMFMGQLVNPHKYNVYSNFWTSSGPLKEVLIEYAEKEYKGEPHVGETPPQIIDEVVRHGALAVAAMKKIPESSVTQNKDEFLRLKNDVGCYDAFANCFAEKVKAAMLVLRYKYSNDLRDLEAALPHLEKSLEYFIRLTDLTKDTYLYANSMQTQQRRIPISGAGGKNKTWEELLPHYLIEVENFKRNIEQLKKTGENVKEETILEPVDVAILTKGITTYPLQTGQQPFNNHRATIAKVADGLQKLNGIKLDAAQQGKEGLVLRFRNDRPVKALVGYFNTNSYAVLQPPTLETNANANDRGQADIRIANAMMVKGLHPVNVYTYLFDAGENELILDKGLALILGFISGDTEINPYDAGKGLEEGKTVDWLFY